MLPIIAISREVGSGGHAIGEKVAEALGIPFLDRVFIEEVAKKTGMNEQALEMQNEVGSWADKYFNSKFYNALYFGDPQDEVYKAQKEIILEEAKKGPCVVVGRCAAYILKKAGIPVLSVFIHADMDVRKENMLARVGEMDIPIEKFLAKKDKGRRFYHKYYTDQDLGDYNNYQLMLDSGMLGEDTCARIIIETAKGMAE